jgi:glyoxylase-like metal-dependent hydrolase (beta-lactamase superfamily II)
VTVHTLPAGPIQTNAYLLIGPAPGPAVLIDAPGGIWGVIEPILRASGRTLGELWLTHGHWDHTQGAAEVVRRTGARVRAHRADRVLIETPEVMRAFLMPGLNLEPVKVDAWLEAGERLAGPPGSAEVRHVPGHCPGNVLFYFAAEGRAFVGDALFNGGIGRTDLPGGSFPQLEESIRGRIYSLPDATIVHPGHGPETTVGAEKAGNPFVRG